MALPSALSLGDLANNIASATKGLATAFGLANPEPHFPEFANQGITADFQREHWYKNPSQGLYSFTVEEVGQGTISEFPAFIGNIKSAFDTGANILAGTKDQSFGEFKLPITPQEITQTEDFAVSIKPTQGGTIVNHSGNKYKTMTISGTTGVQPFRGNLGAFKGTGASIGQPDDLQFRSGYEVFQHFRMWMRAYHEMKAAQGNTQMRMLWRNYKDWEFLYVEPIKFTMKRDASKPLLYNYFIQFKVLGVLTIEKPLFDLAVGKLNEISAAVVNTYALIKKNKAVTENITGTISDLVESQNNLKLALKASNQEDLKLADMSKSLTQKLSYKETLSVLGVFGNAMVKGANDTRSAEQAGTVPNDKDPNSTGLGLISLSQVPGSTNSKALTSKLNKLLDNETALSGAIGSSELPKKVQQSLLNQQTAAVSISRKNVVELKDATQETYDKLMAGVGLGDDTYDTIFDITPTSLLEDQSQVTDDQIEMMYALSQTINNIDGILSSDEFFDRNASLLDKSNSQNGASTVGQGIFSFPSTNGGVKEGFLPSNASLEDIALAELGDSSRWTEIAELNGLKAPYIVSATDTLGPNYTIQSERYSDPSDIRNLLIGQFYLVTAIPTPVGPWTGKGDFVAEFMGGDFTSADNWRFIYPDDSMLIYSVSTDIYLRFEDGLWVEVSPANFNTDGVLKPGDKIKIPSNQKAVTQTASSGPRDNPFTNTLSNAEKSLLVDLKLNDQMDLDLKPSGDLNAATGFENGAQAIVLKLLYEKGSLKKFPNIGTNLTPGKKMPDIATLRSDITTSLLQDPRIKNVTKINLIQENSAVTLSFEVIFENVQTPIPINIPV